ncbi:PspC domain-containing protein [Cellulophaga baltica]|uniref:PspC domain-containing protein n=1 Tax=Cellulophaga TaxID=104264 RepID=UPI001C06F8CC|nr:MULTISPECIES: PspC domain-containing protein [Cellulophaga]MBU2997892.1 PspC domain-containing protein [Cellulophaga baltica]MDO6769293.1 PspC domain-containing protein [Cellulophaga sp. 1_MG-2023]
MNKTVNINLANVLFHIDENAYIKMQRYLEAVKRSLNNTAGSDEILADIEARIAELFHEKLVNERQVITIHEVDKVIAIMGQPEDYKLDDEVFGDDPAHENSNTETQKSKKFYRDVDNKIIAGVSSGLGHYFGIDPIWVRAFFIIPTLASFGSFILIYAILWVLIPEARTTAEKLDMRGEAINISNIERRVKEGFADVSEKVKSVDYEKVGDKVKSGSKSFFENLGALLTTIFSAFGNFFKALFKIFGKFIGVLLVLSGVSIIILLIIALFSIGLFENMHLGPVNVYELVDTTNTPLWLVSTFVFFVFALPFFALFYLGLKILIKNLKPLNSIATYTLLGIFLISLIGIIVISVRQATSRAFFDSTEIETEHFVPVTTDTLNIEFKSNSLHWKRSRFSIDDMFVSVDDDGNEILVSKEVNFILKSSKDSLIHIKVQKNANGTSFLEARETSERIDYNYELVGNTLYFDDFLTTNRKNKFKNQEVDVLVYLPRKMLLKYPSDGRNNVHLRMENEGNLRNKEAQKHIWKTNRNDFTCLDCINEDEIDNDDARLHINNKGINININQEGEKGKIKIDENGIDIDVNDNGESFKLKIDENGVFMNPDEDNN